MAKPIPYWESKPLTEMTDAEWESLCDGCGKCCLHKFIEDEEIEQDFSTTDHINDKEEMHYTNIVCRYLNDKTCSCTQYKKRTVLVPDCVKLTKDNLQDIFFMPASCTYRRIYEGKGLPDWHPLLHKNKKSAMHKAGQSVRGKVVSEEFVDFDNFEEHIVTWPLSEG